MIFYTFVNENAKHSDAHKAAFELLSYGLKKLYGIADFRIVTGKHGKPYLEDLPEIHFNVSHCSGLALCGIAENEIGIDGELIRSYDPKIMKRIFSIQEQELITASEDPETDFFRIWTLKEALGKYLGTGLFSSLKEYSFSLNGERPLCESFSEKIFTQKILHEKWVVSICAHDPENDFVLIENQ